MSLLKIKDTRPTLRSVLGRSQLKAVLMAVSLAGIFFALLGVLALRVYADQNLQLIARSINASVETAIVLNDHAAANEALALIASPEEVLDAKVFDAGGQLFARWRRQEKDGWSLFQAQIARGLLGNTINRPILYQGHEIGSLELTGHGGSLLNFLLSGLAGIVLCMVLGAASALHRSRRWFSGIIEPLSNLARAAHAVRYERTFDCRVPVTEIVELNDLGGDFNALLDELEIWQSHLQNEDEPLLHQASHDSLTGLPNRAFFEGRLSRTLRNAVKKQERLAVLFLGSDHFKDINDTFGHAAGDEVLITVASRVRAQLREHDLVAHLSSNKFAVLLSPLHKVEDAQRIAKKIIDSMAVPVQLPDASRILTSVRVAIAVYPDHGSNYAELLLAADAAMYRAKR